MRCCEVPREKAAGKARRFRGLSGVIGSGALLILLPKCPVCVAVYLAFWTGAGFLVPAAHYVRLVAAGLFVGSLLYVLARWVLMRRA